MGRMPAANACLSDSRRIGGSSVRDAFLPFHREMSEIPIDFRPVLDAVNAEQGLRRIDPIQDAPIADTQFAEAGKFIRHPH